MSAAGLVGFLQEPDPDVRSFALERLNDEIDLLWPEVAGSVAQMYVLLQIQLHREPLSLVLPGCVILRNRRLSSGLVEALVEACGDTSIRLC